VKTIVFSKLFQQKSPPELVELAHSIGIDGYDLTVRAGHPVNPDNAEAELPRVAALMRQNGLDIPMITGEGGLLEPSHPTALPILRGMDRADVRLLKLGYWHFKPDQGTYAEQVGRIRGAFEQWQALAREYGVKICYHTHSGDYMGMNCASLLHLLSGFDPQYLGAYVDPAHLVAGGEGFAFGLAMVREYLGIIALKDILLTRAEKDGHGSVKVHWVPAGQGMVDWTGVFECIRKTGYDGPLSIHCEFEVPEAEFMDTVRKEVAFFKSHLAS
jgi:L-ribulose-5-phosphate 3-epimerase